MKTIECTASYKMGHTFLKCRTTLAVRNINYIQEVPPEVPEYTDGINTRVALPTGEHLLVLETFDVVSKAYVDAMDTEG